MLDRFGDGHDGLSLGRGNSMACWERAAEGLLVASSPQVKLRFDVGREATTPPRAWRAGANATYALNVASTKCAAHATAREFPTPPARIPRPQARRHASCARWQDILGYLQ